MDRGKGGRRKGNGKETGKGKGKGKGGILCNCDFCDRKNPVVGAVWAEVGVAADEEPE